MLQLLFSSGWRLLLLPLAWFPVLLLATQGWRQLFKATHTPSFGHALPAIWMGCAVNNVLPVVSIGGEVVKARLLTIWGTHAMHATASVMVDKAVQALTLGLWGMIGVLLLLSVSGNTELAGYAALGFFVLLGGGIIKTPSWEGVAFSAKEVDEVIGELYVDKLKIVLATVYRLGFLTLHGVELWLAGYLPGRPVGMLEALMLPSLTATLSDIAFIIPNACGIQEGLLSLLEH